MTRDELKEQIDKLMRQYSDEEIDGIIYAQKMMELTTSVQNESDEGYIQSCSYKENGERNLCITRNHME